MILRKELNQTLCSIDDPTFTNRGEVEILVGMYVHMKVNALTEWQKSFGLVVGVKKNISEILWSNSPDYYSRTELLEKISSFYDLKKDEIQHLLDVQYCYIILNLLKRYTLTDAQQLNAIKCLQRSYYFKDAVNIVIKSKSVSMLNVVKNSDEFDNDIINAAIKRLNVIDNKISIR